MLRQLSSLAVIAWVHSTSAASSAIFPSVSASSDDCCPPPYCPSPTCPPSYCPSAATVTETQFSTATVHDTSFLYTTIVQDHTIYTTATQIQFTTDYEHTTKYVTKTSITTYETAYPVTVTTLTNCIPQNDSIYGYETGCDTVTITRFHTQTATASYTVIVPTTATRTQIIPTTVPTTIISYLTSLVTKFVPTTYLQTTTISVQYPITVTSDHTITAIRTATKVDTDILTITTSYPVVSVITQKLIQTLTRPGPTRISTFTLPAKVITLSGAPITRTITQTLLASTITRTRNRQVVTETLPPSTRTVISTSVQNGPTVMIPGAVVTITPSFIVTLCPSLTRSYGPGQTMEPLSPDSDLTFGCKPGFVCNPPKPDGCNFFPGPPAVDYLCQPQDCIIAPPFPNITWSEYETDYYPPSFGYFDLDPEAFGLSYDIFEYETYEKVKSDGQIATITTGNWESRASLSQWPQTTEATTRTYEPPPYQRRKVHFHKVREITPAVCYDDCNNAWKIAESIGKSDELCVANADFTASYTICENCIVANEGTIKGTIRDYVSPQFAQFLGYCDGRNTTTPTSSMSGPVSEVTGTVTLITESQEPPVSTIVSLSATGTGISTSDLSSTEATLLPSTKPASTILSATEDSSTEMSSVVVTSTVTLSTEVASTAVLSSRATSTEEVSVSARSTSVLEIIATLGSTRAVPTETSSLVPSTAIESIPSTNVISGGVPSDISNTATQSQIAGSSAAAIGGPSQTLSITGVPPTQTQTDPVVIGPSSTLMVVGSNIGSVLQVGRSLGLSLLALIITVAY